MPNARIRMHNGAPTLFLDGTPVSAGMHWLLGVLEQTARRLTTMPSVNSPKQASILMPPQLAKSGAVSDLVILTISILDGSNLPLLKWSMTYITIAS